MRFDFFSGFDVKPRGKDKDASIIQHGAVYSCALVFFAARD